MNETPDGWDPSAVLDRYAALGGDSQSFEFLQLRHFHKDRTYPRFLREIARRVGGEDPAAVQICVDFMIADDPGSESFYVRKTISDRLRKVTLSESQSAALSSHFLTLAAGTARNRGCSMDWRCWRTVINWRDNLKLEELAKVDDRAKRIKMVVDGECNKTPTGPRKRR